MIVFAALSVVHRISTRIEEEAEDSFQPSFEAAQGSIASAAAHRDIFVTKDQAAELYAGRVVCLSVLCPFLDLKPHELQHCHFYVLCFFSRRV